jgi:DNA-binding transcriptional ArsR family regulator
MSFRLVADVLDRPQLYAVSGTKLLILVSLADWSDDFGEQMRRSVTLDMLAARTRVDPRTVRRCLAELEREGLVIVDRDPGGPSGYRVLTPDILSGVTEPSPRTPVSGVPRTPVSGVLHTENGPSNGGRDQEQNTLQSMQGTRDVTPVPKEAQLTGASAQVERRKNGGKRQPGATAPPREQRADRPPAQRPWGVADILATIQPGDDQR